MAMSMATEYSIPENAIVVGLCAGRHDMPVGEFIFPTEVDPTDFRAMSRTVDAFLDTRVGTHISWGLDAMRQAWTTRTAWSLSAATVIWLSTSPG